MPCFLLELLSEEIPAGMQGPARFGLERNLRTRIAEHGIVASGFSSFSTPRRLCVIIDEMSDRSAPSSVERRGPRVGAPEKAVAGFLRSVGKTRDQLDVREVGGTEYYFSIDSLPGKPIETLLPDIVRQSIEKVSWGKSMRWGSGRERWVRPLRSILCLHVRNGSTHHVDVEYAGIRSAGETYGHMFMSPGPFVVDCPGSYLEQMRRTNVIVDQVERQALIRRQIDCLMDKSGLTMKADDELVDEITGLVEWPVTLIGEIDGRYQDLPSRITVSAMRKHQRYLSASKPGSGRITHFMTVANRETADDSIVVRGNLRVLNARLADAQFFLENDRATCRKSGLDGFAERLDRMLYHRKLGSQNQRAIRIAAITQSLADMLGIEAGDAVKAARHCKSDLVSEIVTEFPDLQGIMGRYLAGDSGVPAGVGRAIEGHYQPIGPGDPVPEDMASCLTGLADRINHLVGMMGSGEKPSGSRDPHALRRTATGLVRIVIERKLGINLPELVSATIEAHSAQDIELALDEGRLETALNKYIGERYASLAADWGHQPAVTRACLAAGQVADLLELHGRVRQVETFLAGSGGEDLLHVYNRIHRIAGGDGHGSAQAPVDPDLFTSGEERRYWSSLNGLVEVGAQALIDGEWTGVLARAAGMRPVVDEFFDNVMINVDEVAVRNNRHALLGSLLAVTGMIADFSLLEKRA